MILSWWEQLVLGFAVSFLTLLKTKLTNTTELAALDAALVFLQDLLAGKIGASAS